MWNRSPINVFSKRGGLAVQLFTSELKEGPSPLSKDEFAKFLTKTERKERKNTQNLLLDRCYLLFKEYLQEKNCIYILKLWRRIGQSLEESQYKVNL